MGSYHKAVPSTTTALDELDTRRGTSTLHSARCFLSWKGTKLRACVPIHFTYLVARENHVVESQQLREDMVLCDRACTVEKIRRERVR